MNKKITPYFGDYIKIINKDIADFQECEYGRIIKERHPFQFERVSYTIMLDNGNEIELYGDDYIIKVEEEQKMEYNCNKEIKAKDLLKKWIELNTKEENLKRDKEIEKIYNKDEVAVELAQKINQIEIILDEFINKYPEMSANFKLTGTEPKDVITDDSKKEIKKINEKYDKLNAELKNIANEVVAAISICETEESLRNVLKTYNIIDKNGKIKIK